MTQKQNQHVPRVNTFIWLHASAVPRLRVLVDRKGWSNVQVRDYMIKRFGWDEKTGDMRGLSYQVSHLKRHATDKRQIWKIAILRKMNLIADDGLVKTVPRDEIGRLIYGNRKEPFTLEQLNARRRVRFQVEHNRRFKMADFEYGKMEEMPEGYTTKWIWLHSMYGTKTALMAIPNKEDVEIEDSVAA